MKECGAEEVNVKNSVKELMDEIDGELSKKNKVSKRRKVKKSNSSFLTNIINKIKRK